MSLAGYGPLLLEGAYQTLKISGVTFLIGSLVGLIGAYFKLSGILALRWCTQLYTSLVRGIPELLILLLVFFGGTALISEVSGEYYEVDAFVAGVFSLSLIFGAYATEVFRGSFEVVDKGALEAAHSFGMTPWQVFYKIHWPLSLRHALPGLSNLWLVLLKESALLSVIGLEELMRRTQIAVGATKRPFDFYLFAAILYLLMTLVSEWLIGRSRKKSEDLKESAYVF